MLGDRSDSPISWEINHERLAEMTSPRVSGVTKMKGNVVDQIARENQYDVLVRSGGPNAGHKVKYEDGEVYCFYHLPSATKTLTDAKVVLTAGAVIYPPKLMKEVEDCGLTPNRLFIDPEATVIEEYDREFEAGGQDFVGAHIGVGSTGQGVGSAVSRRILRNAAEPKVRLAKDHEDLAPFTKVPARDILMAAVKDEHQSILVEGTQGTQLSLYHGPEYPYCTSRDCSASGVLSEAGLSPLYVNRIYMICRTYPIRVQSPKDGTSGPMHREIEWETVSERSGIPMEELQKTETTSTTKRRRRVGEFDWNMMDRSMFLNAPTNVVITFADYLGIENRNAECLEDLNDKVINMISDIENRYPDTMVSHVSVGFGVGSVLNIA